uniref:Uncharacterized protein n=1 Tax=Anopheles epiroticus TaxID=199890 RepID=A0A182P3F1_9DIPT
MDSSTKKSEYLLIPLTIKLLKMIRFWNESPGQRISTFGVFVVVSYPIVWLIPSWLFILSSQDDVKRLMKAVNEQIVFLIVFFKLFFYAVHYRRLEQLFYDVQRAFSTVMNDPSIEIQKILGHVTKSTHNLTKYYCSALSFNCAAYGLFPMLFIVIKYAMTGSYAEPLPTPIEANYFIPDYHTNLWMWLPLDLTLNLILTLDGLSLFLLECFTWNLVYVTSRMFQVLKIQSDELLNRRLGEEEWAMALKRIITLHDSVLRSAFTLEEILSGQLLLLYISTIFALCLGMVVLSLAFEEVYLLLTTSAVLGYCIFQTFSFSYLGTELIEQSSAVSDAIFHSAWYTQDVKRQKDLCFVLLRANKPVRLTAAKFFVVTRDSFTQVIKQAYTIFTLMSQFLNDRVK